MLYKIITFYKKINYDSFKINKKLMNKLIAIFICLLTVNINICLSNNDISIETKEHQISKIIITGNKITKESIILRELSFKKGDLIDIAKLKK